MMTSDLKAMFWKECRENARWAVLALLGLSLGLAYAWFHLSQQSFPILGQIWSSENLVLTITTPLIGLVLGLLQILPELRRDQWAFLVHRPASRTTLFFGKVLPGVCLYLLATILPLLGLAAWTASPRHVPAPFDFRFTLAGWAAILAGLPFYFAGLLVALRPARWYGSRALPILTALLAPLAAAELYEFWLVALSCLLTTAALLCAAWGSFVGGGEYGEQTKPARFALGLALYPAVVAVAIGGLMLAFAAYNGLTRPHSSQEWWRNEYKIDAQGRIAYVSEHHDDQGKDTKTVTDLAGRPASPGHWLDFVYLFVSDLHQEYYLRYSDPTRYVIDLTTNISDNNQTFWYYEGASHQLVVYSAHANVPAPPGYLGPKGFARDQDKAGRFPDSRPEPTSFAGLHLLRFPQALYWYDTSAPAVGLLQETPGGSSGMTLLSPTNNDEWDAAQALIIAAGGQITAYTRTLHGHLPGVSKLFTVPIAIAPGPQTNIQVAMTPDKSRFFFWYGGWNRSGPSRLVTVASDGRILKSETLPPAKPYAVVSLSPFVQALPALLLPPGLMAFIFGYGFVGHRLGWPSAAGDWDWLHTAGLLVLFSVLGGLLAAVPAWLISRRLGDGRRGQWAWAFGGFWLGGYGVLLLLALRAWPARVPCPNCGRQRVVDRETCEHCGATFARPPRDGTEIFDGEREAVGSTDGFLQPGSWQHPAPSGSRKSRGRRSDPS